MLCRPLVVLRFLCVCLSTLSIHIFPFCPKTETQQRKRKGKFIKIQEGNPLGGAAPSSLPSRTPLCNAKTRLVVAEKKSFVFVFLTWRLRTGSRGTRNGFQLQQGQGVGRRGKASRWRKIPLASIHLEGTTTWWFTEHLKTQTRIFFFSKTVTRHTSQNRSLCTSKCTKHTFRLFGTSLLFFTLYL